MVAATAAINIARIMVVVFASSFFCWPAIFVVGHGCRDNTIGGYARGMVSTRSECVEFDYSDRNYAMSALASGLTAWMIQRVSAVYLAVFLVYSVISLSALAPLDYSHWMAWINHSYRHLFIALFFVALIAHAWVGGRDVILDYIHPYVWQLLCLVMLGGALLFMLLWALRILYSVPVT